MRASECYARIAPPMRQAFSEPAENCSLTPLFRLRFARTPARLLAKHPRSSAKLQSDTIITRWTSWYRYCWPVRWNSATDGLPAVGYGVSGACLRGRSWRAHGRSNQLNLVVINSLDRPVLGLNELKWSDLELIGDSSVRGKAAVPTSSGRARPHGPRPARRSSDCRDSATRFSRGGWKNMVPGCNFSG